MDRSVMIGIGIVMLLMVAALALIACDQRRIETLQEGVATEADVRARFGKPTAVHDDGAGARTLEFTRQPEGHATYMISIGADGRMSALRQVLAPAYFDQVRAGMSQQEVRRLLGTPARDWAFALKNEAVWDWRWRRDGENRVFSVRFGLQGEQAGRVIDSSDGPDPRDLHLGG